MVSRSGNSPIPTTTKEQHHASTEPKQQRRGD